MFEHLHNAHKGETCIVIGNGPSLNRVPSEFLGKYVTFGCNRIYLKYLPTYYVVINLLLIQQFREEINKLQTTKFAREQSGVSHSIPLHLITTPMFSFAPCNWIYDGHNTTFVSLQLAFFLGFKEVKLVGVDHCYTYDGEPNEELFMQSDDPNHFDPSYFKNARWQAPDLKTSEYAYQMAKEAYEANNRKIVNLTHGSALKVFEFEEEPWAL